MSSEALQVKDASAGYRVPAEALDVPPGYKRTEVGVIPDDWAAPKIGQLANVVRGASPRPIDSPIWFDSESSIGWLRISDVTAASKYLETTTQNLSPVGIANSRFVASNNLVMSICATVGRPILTRLNVCIHDGFVVLANPRADKEYLYYVLSSIEADWSKHGQTGSQMNLNTGLIKSTLIVLPPLPEQRAIAGALSDVDGLLGALEALIAKKRAIKQAAMQQLLTGKTRLPGFSGEWDHTTLGEVAEIKNGATPSTQITALWNGTIPWCTPTDITGTSGKYLSQTERYITEGGLTSCAASLLPPGALLLCSRATIGAMKIATTKICTNQGFKSLVCRQSISNEFLYYLVLTLKSQMIKRAIGSTFLEIGKRDLASITVTMPREGEQTAIATVLSDMDDEITALERRRDKTRVLKQGMMQQLLTGRVRLVSHKVMAKQTEAKSKTSKSHSWAFNEAVVISILARQFGSEQYPLGRKRYTKLSYLLHRHVEKQAEGYLKKAAGPYNPKTRYGGAEKIALDKGYVRKQTSGKFHGFVAADNNAQAEGYFKKWYGLDCISWLEQFRRKSNNDLEVLATVDMAAEELRTAGKNVDMDAVKDVIRGHPEWKAKLGRSAFSDANIARAISESRAFFSSDDGEAS